MNRRWLVWLLVMPLAACSAGMASGPPVSDSLSAAPPPSGQEVAELSLAEGGTGTANVADQRRIVLRNASLRLVVSDVEATVSEAMGMAEDLGGWVVESRLSRITLANDEDVIQASISIRVPAERFDEAVDTLKARSVSIESQTITGQDVTGEYVDLSSQEANLRAAETQLQSIMEAAITTEDVLRVHNELIRVRDEIERIRGRLQYFDQSAAFAFISVDLIPEALDQPPTIEIGGWNPVETLTGAVEVLIGMLQGIVDIAIWLIVIGVPVTVIIGVPWWLVRRFLRRRGLTVIPPLKKN